MDIAVSILLVLIFLVVVGGGIFVWIMVSNSREPEAVRKWTDPKSRE